MAGAFDHVAVEFALAERTVVVGAAVFDRVDLAGGEATERDAASGHLNHAGGAGEQIVERSDPLGVHLGAHSLTTVWGIWSWASISSSSTSRRCGSAMPSTISARKPRTTIRSATSGGMPRACR